jgi:hypothetical protein
MPQAPKLAAVTGASAGIGAAFARALAARGSDLMLIARRTDRLQALAAELAERHGTKSEIVTADLNDAAGLERVAERLRTAPQLDLLVNNAGYGVAGLFATSDFAGQEGMHRLHVMATLRLTHAALALRASGSPVRVQALCPGFTYSEFHDVAGMDRSKLAPQAWWCSAGQVVEESLAGLDRDRVFVIPGWRYRRLVGIVGLMPRGLRRTLLMAVARRNGRMAAAKGQETTQK